ncbi:MAG: hypothetical protein A2849_02765 [Candidatus Taylorbacteria bacterium RIFCSPHIGHO2_01_FULL_51_15]|uniref:Rod shape-determining protein MreD n=1 Tax=Candidatus Taylorbacteria bacterium RIFCSPHIGHO2_01_FULL_51_15 TaxID=1802304 RepID=A0A1G2MF92_9BACT|nr:MAG: hypothetical protein A2849_02765 [Candidatus Taylorbacteria bacterium RIFCSPHIGHO2_01_FULL_51_15]
MGSVELKVLLVFAVSLLFRFLPFRPPNVELILASQIPISKVCGGGISFLFGVFSILCFDILTGTLGPWSSITALAYGSLGLLAASYFKHRSTRASTVQFAIIATILYDAATGLTIGPLMFNQSFFAALLGQIPFTLMHLLGNIAFALLWSPLLARFLEPREEGTGASLSRSLTLRGEYVPFILK